MNFESALEHTAFKVLALDTQCRSVLVCRANGRLVGSPRGSREGWLPYWSHGQGTSHERLRLNNFFNRLSNGKKESSVS